MSPAVISAIVLSLLGFVAAHEHHAEDIPEGQAVSAEPIVGLPAECINQYR